MSKCDLRIQFDRPDGQYRGGETVSGRVFVQVNEDIRCKKITLQYFWRIHGRGNRHQDKKPVLILSEGSMLMAGEELEFPFEFEADRWPVSMHGNYINVDHFVHVGVDVPWAFDPKLDQDFIVLPGERPEDLPEDRGEIADLSKGAGQLTGGMKWFVYSLVGIFAVMFSVMLVFLIPFFLIGAGAWWMWRKAVKGRVGEVELTVPHVIVTPGETWSTRMQFTPKKSFAINGVSLHVTAIEEATSGSGTNATTYRHTAFERTYQILPAGTLEGHQPIDEEVVVELPSEALYSLEKPSNRIRWEATARIDIPRFPDWAKKTKLQMLPAEFYGEGQPASENKRLAPADSTPDPFESASSMTAASRESASDVSSPANSGDVNPLVQLLNDVAAAERYGSDRDDLVQAKKFDSFDVDMIIDRVVTTLDLTGNDPRFKGGKTITGTIRGTNHEVELFTVVGSNELLEDLDRGDSWQTLATATEWDSLHSRLVLHEVPFDA